MGENIISTSCCVCGGGPAGMMLGFLLARAGIEVLVLEKHKDFFRDFRGDTLHPSTIQTIDELGLLDEFLKLPHQELQQLVGMYNNEEVTIADFSHLSVAKPILGLMPQWDFLNFLAYQGCLYPGFNLLKEANVTELLMENGRVSGIKAGTPDGVVEVHASIVIGADGRSSTVRKLAGLHVKDTGSPIDVLWFRLTRRKEDPGQSLGRFYQGRIMILIDREEYWQCAYVIAKDDMKNLQEKGLDHFREELAEVTPFLRERLSELTDWEKIKLLTVAIDHLEKWYSEGLLCIGDAAHAMSPIGGVGINLAIQDAVATANILYQPLIEKKNITMAMLKQIQDRRAFPARTIQRLQVIMQRGIMRRKTDKKKQTQVPIFFRLLKRFPLLRRIPARIVGIGIRPEHIRTPAIIVA
jgi:2-polyprenyl-6-methoxyphenol hydroxylase-like FAD-dependent oxidoreductase